MIRKGHTVSHLLLLAMIGFSTAGCHSTEQLADPRGSLNVQIVDTETAKTVGPKVAAQLRLQSQYRKAMKLLGDGEKTKAFTLLHSIADEAKDNDVQFPPRIEKNIRRLLSARAAGPMTDQAAIIETPKAGEPTGRQGQTTTQRSAAKPKRSPASVSRKTERPKSDNSKAYEVHLPALLKPGVASKLISVNFNQVDIKIVLKTISDLTGVNFLVDDNVRGTVTLISPTKIRLGEVYKVLESILEVKGYAAVPAGKLVKIIPRVEATKRNLLTRIGADPAAIPLGDNLVTQIIPLRFADASEISGLIAPLVASGAHVSTYSQTNTILLTDTSSNIHHIAKIIANMDIPGAQPEISVMRLKHASANEVGQQIVQIMSKSQTGLSPQGRSGRGRTVTAQSQLNVLPDLRTNSLIVLASAKETEIIEGLLMRLDIERPMEANSIHVVYLENATAKEMAKSLSGAVAKLSKSVSAGKGEPVLITADESTNALIITASAQDFKAVGEMITKLDIVREQVLVEMRIMEASEDVLKDIGVEWSTLEIAARGVRGFGFTNFGLRVESATGELSGLGVGAFKNVGGGTQIGAIIKALETNSQVNILSKPHILTSNHHEATILVGENIPFVKESRITETDPTSPTVIKTFDYKDVGIELKITPHISKQGLVRLEIDSKFSKLIEGAAGAGVDTPTTAKREAKTVVSIFSGATVVIGGLIRDDKVIVETKVPFLGDIPLIGNLFKRKRDLIQKTNLLLFITPHVLSDRDELKGVTRDKQAETQPSKASSKRSK